MAKRARRQLCPKDLTTMYACMYIPKDLAEDSTFPIKATPANPKVRVKISFKTGDNKLTVEKWREENEAEISIQH